MILRRTVTGFVIATGSLAIIVWLVDLQAVIDLLAAADLVMVGLSLAAVAGALLARNYRWAWLMRPAGVFRPLSDCLPIFLCANAMNLVIPFRGGDVLRVLMFARSRKIPGTAVVASITFEHCLDSLAIVLCVAFLVATAAMPSTLVAASYGLGALVILFVGVVWLFTARPQTAEWLTALMVRIPGRLGTWLGTIARDALQAIQVVRSPGAVVAAIVSTLLIWLGQYYVVATMLLAVQLELPWQASLVVLLANSIGLMVPMAPGNIGVAHAVAVSALAFYGVPFDSAFAFAILFHGVPHVAVFLAGMLAMWIGGLSWQSASLDSSAAP